MSRRNPKLSKILSPNLERQNSCLDEFNNKIDRLSNTTANAADVFKDYKTVFKDIEREFEDYTSLNKIDVTFLFIAVGLQCIRQYVFSNDFGRFQNAQDGDKFIKKVVPKSYEEILCQSVPYDALRYHDEYDKIELGSHGLSGVNHRYLTLGHDPMFGWVFGTINIMCDALTKTDFITTYEVESMKIKGLYRGSTFGLFSDAIDIGMQDKIQLPICVLRQAIHFGSDYFTKQSLPIPGLSTLDANFARSLSSKFSVDMYSITRSAALAQFINLIISYVHTLFDDHSMRPGAYEVKTRKIVSYSNIIASVSNVLFVTICAYYGDPKTKEWALKRLDVGGLLVTIYQVLTNRKYINQIKMEFMQEEFNKKLKNDEF